MVSILAIALSSCGNKENSAKENIVTIFAGKSEPIVKTESDKQYANPVFFGGTGTSFGNYFQALYKIGRFDDMLKLTSSGSISKYGKANILKMYENMEFAYTIKLKSKTGTDTIVLNYEAGIYATKSMVRIPVVIENDTAKIVLRNLKSLR